MDFTYLAFGVVIQSCVELPELAPTASCVPDIRIVPGTVKSEDSMVGWALTPGDLLLWWKDVVAFAIRPGRIVLDPAPDCHAGTVRLLLLGSVLAVALQMAGYLVFHGNTVRIGNVAVVLAGGKGSGKSTLTAALLARGHRLLSDDIAALRQESDGTFTALSGFPAMKLWPDSLANCAGLGKVKWRPLMPGAEKLYLQLGAHQFADHPARLGALWVLERSAVPEIRPMSGTDAFRQLMLHSYCSRYGQAVFRGPMALAHLSSCSALFGAARVEMLRRRDDFTSLDALAEMIEREVDAILDGGRDASSWTC